MQFDKDEMKSRLSKSLRSHLDARIAYYLLMLERVCESPIEVALGAAVLVADQLDHENMRSDLYLANADQIDRLREDLALFVPQFPWAGYRIDFAVRLPRYRFKHIFIECDGHDFHERTKEQAARDRLKDRTIQQAGIPILRFTGSEIYRDAGACAAQVHAFIADRASDYVPRN